MERKGQLPEWKDFRVRGRNESQLEYLQAMFIHSIGQTRSRDHWLDNQIGAVLTTQDLLHIELLGDGTRFKPGILNSMADAQEEIKRKQTEIPDMVRGALKDANVVRQAREWSNTKRNLWRFYWAAIVAILGALALVVVGYLFHIQLWNAK